MTQRAQYRPWKAEYATSAPASTCTELAGNVWGYTCAGTNTVARLDCLPWMSGATPTTSFENDNVFYSPATSCPPGWSASKTRTTSSRDNSAFSDEWIHGETAVTCCPTRYGAWNAQGRCRLDLREPWAKTACSEGGPVVETGTVTANGQDRPFAPQLVLRYQASDVGKDLPLNSTGGLSTSAKIAIGVVIPVVVIALLIGAWVMFRRRRRHTREDGTAGKTQGAPEEYRKAELDATEASKNKGVVSSDQAAAETTAVELEGTPGQYGTAVQPNSPVELPSTRHERGTYST